MANFKRLSTSLKDHFGYAFIELSGLEDPKIDIQDALAAATGTSDVSKNRISGGFRLPREGPVSVIVVGMAGSGKGLWLGIPMPYPITL